MALAPFLENYNLEKANIRKRFETLLRSIRAETQ